LKNFKLDSYVLNTCGIHAWREINKLPPLTCHRHHIGTHSKVDRLNHYLLG